MRSELDAGEGRREYPVNVLESTDIAGMPWFRIELLSADPCSGESSRPVVSGWIPAYGRRGKPNAWFYSRGC